MTTLTTRKNQHLDDCLYLLEREDTTVAVQTWTQHEVLKVFPTASDFDQKEALENTPGLAEFMLYNAFEDERYVLPVSVQDFLNIRFARRFGNPLVSLWNLEDGYQISLIDTRTGRVIIETPNYKTEYDANNSMIAHLFDQIDGVMR
jgi:hypothetical protein